MRPEDPLEEVSSTFAVLCGRPVSKSCIGLRVALATSGQRGSQTRSYFDDDQKPNAINDLRSRFANAIRGPAKKIPDAVFWVGVVFARTRKRIRDSGFLGLDP